MPAVSRRHSIQALSAALVGASLPRAAALAQQPYHFGYAAITWGGDDRQAVTDIADVGFRGIQVRTAAVQAFGDRPGELKDLLAQHKLTLVALSSGTIGLDSALAGDELARHARHARFLRDCGGLYLQIIDARPARAVTAADYTAMGQRLTDLGKRTAELGIPLGYHHHMGSLGEAPEEIDRILDATDPAYVKLELDLAHYLQGGGDPVAAIRKYASRLLFLHIKDVRPRTPDPAAAPGAPGSRSYQFVELGQGRVDLKGAFRALAEVRFTGWVVVELDAVPDRTRSPKQCAEANREYITRELRLPL